jgi:hypothetical protein
MNAVVSALPPAVGGAEPRGQPPAKPSSVGSWDATYAAARAVAGRDSDSAQPATGPVNADHGNGEHARAPSASRQSGNAQAHPAIGIVLARQGTLPPSGSTSAASDQSNEGPAAAPQPGPLDEDAGSGDPTALAQSLGTDPAPRATTASLDRTQPDGTKRSTAGQVSRLPDARGDVRADKEDFENSPTDKVADEDPSTDRNPAPASPKQDEAATPTVARTNKIVSISVPSKHVATDAPSNGEASANSQIAISQAALAANSSSEIDPAKKPDDRDSIAAAASATSGAVMSPPPQSPTMHGAAAAQDPEPATPEIVHQTAANLVSDGGGTARIVLSPPTLGHVEVRVTVEASGTAHIAITAATAEGYAALAANHSGLLQHLEQRGVPLGSVQMQLQSDAQLQGDARQNGASGRGGPQQQDQPVPTASGVAQSQDKTVIAYA